MPAPLLTDILICNKALIRLGADQISSLDDGTPTANLCKTLYAPLRDEVMTNSRWKFAKKLVQIGALSTAPAFKYNYAFQIPSDCLLVRGVETDPWDVSEGQIFCNDPGPINVEYTQQVTDPTQWDPTFGDALSWRISVELSMPLTQSTTILDEMMKGYKDSLAQARALNAIEATPQRLIADLWSGARKGYNYLKPMNVTSEPYNP